ncbi:MAG: metallophosphoesterase [Ignavibacteriales bacterium]|nr:metallophosphoesterase [Ignavibacteriales bacterium]
MRKGINHYIVIKLVLIFSLLAHDTAESQNGNKEKLDVTFFVAADLHFDPPPETDQYYHVAAMNSISGIFDTNKVLTFLEEIGGSKTGFGSCGQKINIPKGVVLVGDITDRAEPSSLKLLKERYEIGMGINQIHFQVYVGLGNHDLDPQHVEPRQEEYRKQMLNYVTARHQGNNAPVSVDNFDSTSHNYSWNWGNLHLVQTHRFAGNIENGHVNSLEWLKADLKKYASNGEPVIIFQHYGFDKFSLGWWSDAERNALKEVLKDYNVVGIFTGHNHFAENLKWGEIPVFQVNNAWKDEDGNGSFAVCHVTDEYIDIVTCRWKDGEGNAEFVFPFYTKKFNQK